MKKIFRYICLSTLSVVAFSACTDDFDKYNTNKEGIYSISYESYISSLQKTIYFNLDYGSGSDWTFQLYQNLNSDMFSGMLSSPTPFGTSSNLTYAMNDGWNSFAWTTANDYMMRYAYKGRISVGEDPNLSIYKAWINILKVASMHRVTDLYGPIIYTEFGKSNTGVPYDAQSTVYAKFFEELDEAIDLLSEYQTANPGNARFEKADLVYKGNMTSWIKFANTLKLRLAMTCVKSYPDAQKKAEEAVNNAFGVLTDVSEVAAVSGMGHPLAAISGGWGDAVMSADMESMLVGYNDPRLSKYFVKSKKEGSPIDGKYKGVRLGVAEDKGVYGGSSVANLTTATPPVIATPAEAYFLRAEGALRGWNMNGAAKDLYESGINASFAQYGVSDATYLTSDALPANYNDPIIAANSINAVNLVSPKWDETASNEVKLQKIITQKWIAEFPDGALGWVDVRRTGYPKLFPVVKNLSQGVISTIEGPRRLPFPSSEKIDNSVNYEDGVSKLGGPDNGATRLWWDVNKGNF